MVKKVEDGVFGALPLSYKGVSEVMNEMNAGGRFRSYDLSVMSR